MDKILKALQAQAWERAKGELAAIQQADYAPAGMSEGWKAWDEKCAKRRKLINEFIKAMEGDELYC